MAEARSTRCPACGTLYSHDQEYDDYCRLASEGKACGFVHPSMGACIAGALHVTNHYFDSSQEES